MSGAARSAAAHATASKHIKEVDKVQATVEEMQDDILGLMKALEEKPIEYDELLPFQRQVREFYESFFIQISIALFIVGNFFVSASEAQVISRLDGCEYKPPPPIGGWPDGGVRPAHMGAGQYFVWEWCNDGHNPTINGDTDLKEVYSGLEWMFNMVFLAELVLNMYGSFFWTFWGGPNSAWNIFDFIVVASSIIDIAMSGMEIDLSVLRLLRAFRVFRLFKRVESLRSIIEGVLASIPGVLNAFAVLFIFMGIWSIMGVEFFRNYDEDGNLTPKVVDLNGDVDPTYFDTFGYAMFTMFQMLTMDSWCSYITHELVYGVSGSATAALFAITFIFIASIVLTNVVVAILLEKYLTCVQQQEDTKEKRKELKRMIEAREAKLVSESFNEHESETSKSMGIGMQTLAGKIPVLPVTPKELPFQSKAQALYMSDPIQIFVGGLIVLNFFMGAANAQLNPIPGTGMADAFLVGEWFFNIVFSIELFLNMYGHFGHFVSQNENWAWNIFDFIIVVVSWLAALSDGPGISVLRLFRAFRVMRLFKRIESLRMIIEAVLLTLPKVLQAFCVLGILMGVWAIIAVQFFRNTDGNREFGNFTKAMLSMWQILTGDSWASGTYMARYLVFEMKYYAALLFFVSYIFVASIIMSNVVIAILLEGYLQTSRNIKEQKEMALAEERKASGLDVDIELDEVVGDPVENREPSISSLQVIRDTIRDSDVQAALSEDEVKRIVGILSENKVAKAVMAESLHAHTGHKRVKSGPVLVKLLLGKAGRNGSVASKRKGKPGSETDWS